MWAGVVLFKACPLKGSLSFSMLNFSWLCLGYYELDDVMGTTNLGICVA